MPRLSNAADLLARHAELEETLGDGDGGNFLSGWQCLNPWKSPISKTINSQRKILEDSEYLYADRFPEIEKSFAKLHTDWDNRSPERIIFGSGSTSLLLLIASWAAIRNVAEIYYVAPMYFTLHSALKTLGIRGRPINALHPYEAGFSINLPDKKGMLVLTDPTWYSGTRVPTAVVRSIVAWQKATRSFVLIDGSFQYMSWNHSDLEETAALDPSLTFRVICPTKQIVMHGYRASYVLVPEASYREVLTLHSHLFGSLSTDTLAFLLAAPHLLNLEYRKELMDVASSRHAQLRKAGSISAIWDPTDGYFCFEKINTNLDADDITMDGGYFEQPRYPGYARINLLSPKIDLLR